jgi:hypothetical protein
LGKRERKKSFLILTKRIKIEKRTKKSQEVPVLSKEKTLASLIRGKERGWFFEKPSPRTV